MRAMKQVLKKLLSSKHKMPVKQQVSYVDDLSRKYDGYQNDDFLRTYLHYKCIFSSVGFLGKVVLNISAVITIPFLILFFLFNRLRKIETKKMPVIFINANNKYGMSYDYSDRFPHEEIKRAYGDTFFCNIKKYPDIMHSELSGAGFIMWIKLVVRYPFCPYMNLTCLMYLAMIVRLIRCYDPKAIINAKVEANYTSSFITAFCESNDIHYELIMHGDIFLTKRMAFVRFTKIYIWDLYYKELFLRLYAHANEFIRFVPQMFLTSLQDDKPKAELTYYLTGTGDGDYVENVEGIITILKELAATGKTVRVRPHPRWSDADQIIRLCENENIVVENRREISVVDSLATTEYAAGAFSTVLLQGYFAGKKIIIDDVTNPEAFQEIKDANYILLSKKHQLLSEYLNR